MPQGCGTYGGGGGGGGLGGGDQREVNRATADQRGQAAEVRGGGVSTPVYLDMCAIVHSGDTKGKYASTPNVYRQEEKNKFDPKAQEAIDKARKVQEAQAEKERKKK